jgi:succinoglycan biosynthesis transport protein ExoP
MPGNPQDIIKSPAPAPAGPAGYRPDYAYYEPLAEDLPAPGSPFRIQRFLRGLLKYWWIPVITLVLALGGAVAYVWYMPPTYVSRARMWETVKVRLPEGGLFTEDMQNFGGTQSDLLKSSALHELALARLRSLTNSVPIPRGDDGNPLPVQIKVSQSSKSAVFVLEASGSHAAYTQAYLDALMAVYLEYKKNVRQEVSGDTLASISEQVQKAERDLKFEQDALMIFQRTNNLAIIEEEGRIAGGYLARLKTQLSDLELEARLLAATALAQTTNAATNAQPLDLAVAASFGGPSSSAPAEHQATFKEIELLKLQRERLSKNLRPKHPKIVKLDADIERGEKLAEIYRRQSREQLASSQAAIQLKMENVRNSIREWEGKVVEANSRIAEAERLKMNVQRAQGMYERLALLVQNVGISRNIDQETLAILEPASLPERSYTREIGLAGMAGFGGLGLGLGLIFLIVVRDDRFESVVEVTEKLPVQVVGQVPEISGARNGSPASLLRPDDDRHAYAESFRGLRSALLFMAVDQQRPRVLLVTSAVPNEGKSTVAANLARTLAQGGARVVLLDGDLRKGVLHQFLGLQRAPGFAEALGDPNRLDEVIQTDPAHNFSFIGSGHLAGNSGDLFLGPGFETVISRLREKFDYVLIDSSPVFAADDAATLAPRVDGTLFVVRNRYSGARIAREALELLYQRQAKVLGLVFNRANAASRSYYYYKYADYYPAARHA